MKILLTFAHPLLIGNFFPTVIEHKLEDTEKIPGVLLNGTYGTYPSVLEFKDSYKIPPVYYKKKSKYIP